MSDFFGNLAARSLPPNPTAAPVLQPRLPSLFEPPTGAEPANVPDFEPPAGRTFPVPAIHPSEPEPNPLPESRARTQRSTIPPEEPLPPQETVQESMPSISPKPRQSERFTVPPERTILTRFERESVVREQIAPGAVATTRQPPSRDSQPDSPSVPDEQPTVSPIRRAQKAEEPTAQANPIERTIRHQVVPVPLQPSVVDVPTVLTSTPQVLQAPESALEEDGARETTVRIHIGRIEVRAVQAPQPVPPARSAPATQRPKLTLDEYLRRRNEGQR